MEFVHEENKPLQCRICDPLFALKLKIIISIVIQSF